MILVLFFLVVIILFTLIIIFSSIRIKAENIVIKNLKANENNKICFQIYFLNKIKIFSKKLNTQKLKSLSNKKNINMLKNKNIKIDKESIKIILNIKPKIEMLNLDINIGVNDVCITSYLVGVIGSIISIIVSLFSSNNKKINYRIQPIFNRNIVDVFLDCIISIKIVHIIYVIFKLIKKGRIKNERTSDRRINAYSYE